MKKGVIAALVGALGLSGCVTSRMNDGLSDLVGLDVDAAVAVLGYPDGQREMMGDTLYIWSSNHNVVLPMATTTTTTGNFGGVPYYGSTTGMGYMPANLNCTIQLAVGPNKVIKSWQWNGNMGGCQPYARSLRSLSR
jgi:hypothetical protein